ncbi:MAG: hypothetical protein ACNA8W_15205, partial [Bradymonadaceae bacterium]
MKAFATRSLLPFLATFLLAASAMAATVSGTISASNGTGIANMEVRLWEQTPKGFTIAYTVQTVAGGTYSFTNVAAGGYKLDARMAPGVSGHYGDTWYDVEEPSSNGLFPADADILTINAGDVLTGIDITLPLTGGFDGQILAPGGAPLSGVVVRAESLSDHRYGHNDYTKTTPHNGRFSMRGLISSANGHQYRLIVYDFQGRYETLIIPGPIGVIDGVANEIGPFTMVAIGTDPNGPNNTAAQGTPIGNLPYTSTGAIISPRGSDVDWYCFEADEGARLHARADATLDVGGEVRRHPWIDPIMSFWTGDGS